MKAEIEKAVPNARVELIEGSGGVFEVKRDGRSIYSKKQTGRFPEPDEILRHL